MFCCYPSHTPGKDNPLLSLPTGAKYDPLMVEITKHIKDDDTTTIQAKVYRNGQLIAHSAAEETSL